MNITHKILLARVRRFKASYGTLLTESVHLIDKVSRIYNACYCSDERSLVITFNHVQK